MCNFLAFSFLLSMYYYFIIFNRTDIFGVKKKIWLCSLLFQLINISGLSACGEKMELNRFSVIGGLCSKAELKVNTN